VDKLEKKLVEFCNELRKSFEGVDKEIKDVGKKYYLYDRTKWLKQEWNRDDDEYFSVKDTDEETLRIYLIQRVLFGQIIFEDENGKIVDRKSKDWKDTLNE
jgi:hypothetical protein